jgi:flagellar motor switch protein FliN
METFERVTKAFIEGWIPEFQKSVEMFTGTPVTAQATGESVDVSGVSAEQILWQGQTFEGTSSGTVWIGTPIGAYAILAEPLAEDGPGRESIYRELLKQAFEGAAHILNAGRAQKIACKEAIEDRAPPSDLARWESVKLALPGWEGSPVLIGIDAAFATLLSEVESAPEELRLSPPAAAPVGTPEDRRIDRLADLELPVSVVLGQAKMQIREVLKLTAGSLVELDRRIGEPVEIVVHNSVVARGEVVSIGGNYGVRIVEVISRRDRYAIQAFAARSSRTAPRPTIH